MIADQVIPCAYEIEFSGEIVRSFFAGDFGLHNISIVSDEYDSDIEATHEMNRVMDEVLTGLNVETGHVTKSIEYNGRFYPGGAVDNSEEKATAQADIDLMSDQYAEEGKIPILLSRSFDDDGDFIQSRHTYWSYNFSIVGKIQADIDKYMWFLGTEQLARHETIDRSSLKTHITVH
jgi:hypothetical protein